MFRYRNFKPLYVKSNKKAKYLRKRQSANVARAKSLYTRYSQPRSLNQTSTYSIRRMLSPGAVQVTTTFADYLYSFRLTDLPDNSEFTALYDQYRVDKMVVHIIPNCDIFNSAATPQDTGTLLTAVDFDGGATGLTLNQFMSYESCEMTEHGKSKKITIKPRGELAAIDSGSSTVSAAMAPDNMWWDCSNTLLKFNGVRYATTANSAAASWAVWYTLWVEVFITFKNTR